MTPEEYLKLETEQRAVIDAAQTKIDKARKIADRAKPPPKSALRKARADDIRYGLIIWHDRAAEHGGWFWHVVDEPLHYGDAFKAYTADDGCRYGLDGAWVMKSNND